MRLAWQKQYVFLKKMTIWKPRGNGCALKENILKDQTKIINVKLWFYKMFNCIFKKVML
jgi:hypothetical protein